MVLTMFINSAVFLVFPATEKAPREMSWTLNLSKSRAWVPSSFSLLEVEGQGSLASAYLKVTLSISSSEQHGLICMLVGSLYTWEMLSSTHYLIVNNFFCSQFFFFRNSLEVVAFLFSLDRCFIN